MQWPERRLGKSPFKPMGGEVDPFVAHAAEILGIATQRGRGALFKEGAKSLCQTLSSGGARCNGEEGPNKQ